MKKLLIRFGITILVMLPFSQLYSQDLKAYQDNLNTLLEKSLYESRVVITPDSVLLRDDNNGNKYKFSLADIVDVSYKNDGFHNVIVTVSKGSAVESKIVGKEILFFQINVFAFSEKGDCDKFKSAMTDLYKKIAVQ